MGLLSKAAKMLYRPRLPGGFTTATERFPFGFLPLENSYHPRLRADQFFPVDEYADWSSRLEGAPPEETMVRLSDLVGTQPFVHPGFLDRANKKPITVTIGDDGRLLIINGHHRAARASARGDEEILARVWSPDAGA